MIVGFTGTRRGMTGTSTGQVGQLLYVLALFRHADVAVGRESEFHHGGAEGADRRAAKAARESGYRVHWHPCPGVSLSDVWQDDPDAAGDVWHEVFPPLVRNRHIAEGCHVLVAAPATDAEQLRSGTWATVRYAREARKPVVMLSRGVR